MQATWEEVTQLGIVSEQVCGIFDGTNYCERAESLSASSTTVQLVGFRSCLVAGGGATVGNRVPNHVVKVGWTSMDDSCGRRWSHP